MRAPVGFRLAEVALVCAFLLTGCCGMKPHHACKGLPDERDGAVGDCRTGSFPLALLTDDRVTAAFATPRPLAAPENNLSRRTDCSTTT